MSPAARVRERLWGGISLIHPFPVATVVATSAVLLVVAFRGVPPAGLLARALAAVLSTQVAVGALNDYLDRGSDAAGQPWKPIPSGKAAPATALFLVGLGLLGTAALAATFGPVSLGLLAFATAGGLAYDLWLKPTPLSILGYLVGFLGLASWIWFIAGRLALPFAAVYPLGAVAVVTAHLAQSLPDVQSDRARGQRGLAATLGVDRTEATIRLGLAAMGAGAALLAIAARSLAAGIVAGIGAVLGFLAFAVFARGGSRTEAQRASFRFVAVAVAVLSVSALISLDATLT